MRLTFPYREKSLEPRFGAPTAPANFCEEDFIITSWIAEFVNTLTNIAYIIYAYQGLRRAKAKQATLSSQALYFSLMAVGICSALFHGVLKYSGQIADDTSMQVATGLVLHRAMTFDGDARFTTIFTTGLVALLLLEITYNSLVDEDTAHDLTFLTQILIVAVKTRSLNRSRVTRADDKRRLGRLTILGAACFVIGYILWQLDFIFCETLTATKRQWGMPLGFLLELHGWWHVLTAIGAYIFIVMVDTLTQDRVDLSNGVFSWLGSVQAEPQKEH